MDVANNLYGVTFSGGKRGWGTIFKLSPPPPSSDASGAEQSRASAENPLWKEQVLSLNSSTVGGSPTVTINIQGSQDTINWFNIPYALPATPKPN